MIRKIVPLIVLFGSLTLSLTAQRKQAAEPINDFTTPLHLLVPDYSVPYGEITADAIKESLDRVHAFLERETPARVVDKMTGKEITDYTLIDQNSALEQGSFRLASYEWGVTYSGMLAVSAVTGDGRYAKYAADRFRLLAEAGPQFRRVMNDYGVIDPQMRQMLAPHALDDAGAMCAAMIKYLNHEPDFELRPVIDNYMNYIMYREYRLGDGTFARMRPQANTLWLDDMYMSVPAIVQMGRLTGEAKYFNEAVRQIKQFTERMFVPEKGLYMHGWVEGSAQHPAFHWGRANGWAILTLTEVLDVLPESHPQRNYVLDQLRTHIGGIASYQSGDGFWHQLLDRNDSYLETSCTAIFTYCIARAINKGWIDPIAYGPVAQLGWQAVASKINMQGQVEGTCVGTGMAFDPAFYYHRPVNVFAAHGYGPVLLAGAEMIELLGNYHPRMNDSAIQYYSAPIPTDAPIFSVPERPQYFQAGMTRIDSGSPVLFLIGDSTVKNGRGDGAGGQWGWADSDYFSRFFDTSRISVENHALGGRSSRTYITERLWDNVFAGLKPGDYLLIQFGHNDGGPLNTGRARASLKGTGEESETVIMERHGGPEEVFTYGHYMRMYIRQAKAKGAIPVVLSPTPGNRWTSGRMNRMTETYTAWAREIAAQEGVPFIDLNDIAAGKYEAMGAEKTGGMFKDSVHTTGDGALIHAESVIEGLRAIPGFPLNDYLKK